MSWTDLIDRHPLLAGFVLFLGLVVVFVVLGGALAIVALAQVRLTEEEARANPRYFALVGLCKTIGPTIVGAGKWAAGVAGTLAAQALVNHTFGPGIKVPDLGSVGPLGPTGVGPSLGPPPPSPAPSIPEITPPGGES